MGFWHIILGIYGGSEAESAPVPNAIFATAIAISLPSVNSMSISLPSANNISITESP